MEQQIGRADPCFEACEGEKKLAFQDGRGIFDAREYVTITGSRCFNFSDWKQSIARQWFDRFCESADRLKDRNILYFDFEYLSIGDATVPRLACWFESKPPQNIGRYGTAKMDSDVNRRSFIRALYRADIIVGYNLFTLDIRALDRWGFDVEANLLKFIDPYQFFFKYVSDHHQGSLEAVSLLNGGPAKYVRNGCSDRQFVKQCQSDLEMLRHIFDRMLGGRIKTSLMGTLYGGRTEEETLPPIARRPIGSSLSFDEWSSITIEYSLSVGFEGRCAI